jgi:hypothetical protein
MRASRALAAAMSALLAFAADATAASAALSEATRLTSEYSEWAGGRSNADSLVAGLRNAAPITLVTNGPGRGASMAGFTPVAPMSYAAVSDALANARHSLALAGIARPNAEQIQAALTGGEVRAEHPASP